MEKFIIKGGKPLNGEVIINGSKNAAGPALAAALLTTEECIIENVPFIEDIENILEVLNDLGAKVEKLSGNSVKVLAKNINADALNFEKAAKTRLSVLLFGSLLGRICQGAGGQTRSFKMPPPGGDRIGLRPISVQLRALEKMGAKIERQGGVYKVACKKLKGAEIVLEEFSVTATEAVILAAVLAEGRTIIKGAAAEPHVQDLCNMLVKMGAKIEGIGTHTIQIDGVEKLSGCSHKIIPDYIEAGTFIVAGALVPGEIKVKNIDLSHLDLFLAKLEEMGAQIEKGDDYVIVKHSPNLQATKVQALPYPGFPTDLLPIIIPLLITAKGKSLVHDPLYENRFNYVQELRKMGADIEMVDPHRTFVFGPCKLSGSKIDSWDIRAGACLVLAALSADETTTINNIFQIDRGYFKIEERLQKLGADIERVQ